MTPKAQVSLTSVQKAASSGIKLLRQLGFQMPKDLLNLSGKADQETNAQDRFVKRIKKEITRHGLTDPSEGGSEITPNLGILFLLTFGGMKLKTIQQMPGKESAWDYLRIVIMMSTKGLKKAARIYVSLLLKKQNTALIMVMHTTI